jgi:hypothetical protein
MMTSTVKQTKSTPLLTSQEAVESLANTFKRMARKLWPSNERSVQEDLVQEMNLACLSVRVPMKAKTFISVAFCRAVDYLDREARHERLLILPHEKLVKLSDHRRYTTK